MNHPANSDVDTDVPQRTVGIGEYDTTDEGARLVSFGLGSCLGVALFDLRAGVGGLIHIKRPSISGKTTTKKSMFADAGISVLCSKLEASGASRGDISAKMAGGADMWNFTHGSSGDPASIGDRNIQAATDTLDELDIPIVAKDVGGDEHRSVCFVGSTGELIVELGSDDCYSI